MFEEWQATAIEGGPSGQHSVSVPGTPDELAGSDAVRYKTQFSDPRGERDDVAVLELRGLYAHSELEVTGVRLDGEGTVEHDAYFEPLRVAFVPHEEDELVITCRRPRDRFGGLYDTDLVPDRDRVPGIWWDARLEGRPLPYVEDVTVQPELTDDGALLHVRTTVVGDEALSDRLTYSLKPEGTARRSGMMERAKVETSGPGRETLEHTIEVRDPALWWPRELGEQNRYTLRAKLGDSECTVTTGLCDIERDGGRLLVNGEPLSIRGVNLLGATEADIDRARELNANVVRAHASVLSESWYDRCDSEGVLVWQDLPLTGPGPFDTERGRALAETLSRRLTRHPSVAVYTVHDDPTEPFTDGLGSGVLDRLRLRYRAWRTGYDATVAEDIAEVLPDRRPVVPVVGPPGSGAEAGSYYPGWDYGEADDIEPLLARYPVDIVAEFGAGALADSDVDEAAGFDASKHARRADGVEESQAYQATLLRTVTERLRLADVGALAFALRDTDRAGMGLYARDGTPKGAVEELARAMHPIQAFLADPSPGESDVVVINDLPTSFSVTLEWSAGEAGGEFEGTVDGGDRWQDGPVTVPEEGAVELVLHVGDHRVENSYEF